MKVDNTSLRLLGRDRTPFLPGKLWVAEQEILVDQADDPDGWLEAAHSDTSLVTQWDDGAGNPGGLPTCSASMPSLVEKMLDACDLHPGQRILEIGAGTGFTAALLKDRVGPSGRVVSIEVDPSLAATARKRLKDAGVDAEVIAADGLKPSVLDGPFDRIHVTCAIRGPVPAAWIRLCPTGKIMMPWTPTFTHAADYVTTLDVHDGIAMGRFRYPVAFMKARSQRRTPWSEWPEGGETRAYESRLSPGELGAPLGNAGEFVVGLLLPGMEHYTTGVHPSDGERVLWLRHGDRFASLGFGAGISVNVAGDDGLVSDYIAAVEWWMNHGWPDPGGFGLMVRARDDCSHATTAVWHATPGVLVSARSH
ncbi:methyltransferase domain-containing protein [Streptodolium elevatio]|uniref:Protein-L-isoaspartate O-methyltransferase n=1 Tax=Streptodolium elevatio TaxID=3157996 RepID=A0ABV3DN36_9ACTN